MTESRSDLSPAVNRAPSAADRVKIAIVSCGGLGYAPVAPGTFGTVGAMVLVLLWRLLGIQCHFGLVVAGAGLACLLVGACLGGWAERYYGRPDPPQFVLDEVLGYFVALLCLRAGPPVWTEMVVAFVAFRTFDVAKPPPCRQLEHLPGGWGIMLDDVAAGVYAWMLVYVLREHLGWY